MKKILFRCDSSFKIGLGHVKRSLLFAKRLINEDEKLIISFASLDLNGNINQEILKNGFEVHLLKNSEIENLNILIEKLKVDLLVIDSYDIDNTFEKKLKDEHQKLKILSFDDTLRFHNADIVLNHGIHSKKSDYKGLVSKSTNVLCGSQYTLLRDEFFKKYKRKIKKKSIAIILGGNDVMNISTKITNYLLNINDKYKISVITTSVNPNLEKLKTNTNIELLIDINNIAEVLSNKELVICASGGTLFEVIALKKKFINIEVASNQETIIKFLEKKLIHTTIKVQALSKKVLKEKIRYVNEEDIYENIDFKFSKNKLAKKILKELK